MGRFKPSATPAGQPPMPTNVPSGYAQPQPYGQPYGQPQPYGQQPQYDPQMMQAQANWPTYFPKPIIGLEREGVIIEHGDGPLQTPSQVRVIQSSLEAIKMMRLKGYKVMIITQQPGITKKQITQAQVDNINNHLMQVFGQAGIFSIDGVYYSTSDLKEDYYAKPNTGMFERARLEHGNIVWKDGWYVGDTYADIKASIKIGARPVLVRTGKGAKTESELDSFSRRDVKKQTQVFDNLLEFAKSLQ